MLSFFCLLLSSTSRGVEKAIAEERGATRWRLIMGGSVASSLICDSPMMIPRNPAHRDRGSRQTYKGNSSTAHHRRSVSHVNAYILSLRYPSGLCSLSERFHGLRKSSSLLWCVCCCTRLLLTVVFLPHASVPDETVLYKV